MVIPARGPSVSRLSLISSHSLHTRAITRHISRAHNPSQYFFLLSSFFFRLLAHRSPFSNISDPSYFPSDAAYYENWNRERQEAIARGEDPNAKFLALVAAREEYSRVGKLRKLFGKRKEGKKAHGAGLTEEEEREALERDQTYNKQKGREKDDGFIR